MLDLSGQHNAIRTEIDEAIQQVIDSSAFINGTQVNDFAQALSDYTGAKYVIPCGNGTDALQIALMSLGLQAGDEVIVPSFTYIAAAEAVLLLGLKPVFVDVESRTYGIDPKQIEKVLTKRTKVVIPVHLFGQLVHMEPLLELSDRFGLTIIEDSAQSIGTEYFFKDGSRQQSGTIGAMGCLSFFPSKNLGCLGDGGAILTNDPERAARLKTIAVHGQSVKYRHETVGVNSRLDTLQAAVLQVKLKYLTRYNEARRQAAAFYRKELSGLAAFIDLPAEVPYSTHTYHQFTIVVKEGKREELKAFLQEKGIPSMIYYPLALPDQPVFASMPVPEESCPTARYLSQSVLSLPMHTELEAEQLSFIVNQIKAFYHV